MCLIAAKGRYAPACGRAGFVPGISAPAGHAQVLREGNVVSIQGRRARTNICPRQEVDVIWSKPADASRYSASATPIGPPPST